MQQQIIALPLASLRESPFNHRKTFNQTTLEELAETIVQFGVQQPLKVRPLQQADIEHDQMYEIVFGHRRFRAAKLAGLDAVPAIVEEMDDEKARLVQAIENIQREDVNPIEQAIGLAELKGMGVPVAELMERTGKKKQYIYNRLKLVGLTGAAREACIAGTLDAELAVLIASFPPALHDAALKRVTVLDATDIVDGKAAKRFLSYRPAKKVLEQDFTIKLDSAPFSLDDWNLGHSAGVLACTDCPRCSDNDPLILEALGAGVCVDKPCFDGKVRAHSILWVDRAREDGQLIVEGNEAEAALKTYGVARYLKPTDPFGVYTSEGWKQMTYTEGAELMREKGLPGPLLALVVNPTTGVAQEMIPPAQAQHVRDFCIKTLHPEPAEEDGEGGASTPQTAARAQAEAAHSAFIESLTPEQRAVNGHPAWKAVKRATMERASGVQRSVDDLRMIALAFYDASDIEIDDDVIDVMGWREEYETLDTRWASHDGPRWFTAKVGAMDADQLATLIVLLAIAQDATHGGTQEGLQQRVDLAARYGVDVLAVPANGLNEAGPAGEPSDADEDALAEED